MIATATSEAIRLDLASATDAQLQALYDAGVAFSQACVRDTSDAQTARLIERDALVRELFGRETLDRKTLDALYTMASRERSDRAGQGSKPPAGQCSSETFAREWESIFAASHADYERPV